MRSQLDIFKSGKILDKVVELEHEAYFEPAVLGQLPFVVGGDFLPVEKDGSGSERIHSAEDIQDGGLSCSRCADDHAEFTLLNAEVRSVQSGDFHFAAFIDFFDISEFDIGHGSLPLFSVGEGAVV